MLKYSTTKCPVCGKCLRVRANCRIGDKILCSFCRINLRIAHLKPFKLKFSGKVLF